MVKEKVRAKITCISCFKPRVVYGEKRQWKKEEEVLSQIENSHYFCGSPSFDDEHRLHCTFVVHLMLKCEDLLELAFFSSVIFSPSCYYCGIDERLCNPPEELKSQYHTVLPLCSFCQSKKKGWFTLRPKPGVQAKKQKVNVRFLLYFVFDITIFVVVFDILPCKLFCITVPIV